MKVGVRKPSIKKSISAKTKSKATRAIKKSISPTYGRKGIGIIKDPKKSMYNKVYNKTTIDIRGLSKISTSKSVNKTNSYSSKSHYTDSYLGYYEEDNKIEEIKIINRISKIKKLRIWFNIIGYFIVIPSLFNIVVDFKGFIISIKLEPTIIIAVIAILFPFLFMIYKARKFKKEIVLLNNRLDTLKAENNSKISLIDDFDEKLNEDQEIDGIYQISNEVELIERIFSSNSQIIDIITNTIASINKYNFDSLQLNKDNFISNLRDIIKSGEGLLAKNSVDDLAKVYIESIISNAKSIEYHLKQMLLNGEILRIDYEYTGAANCEMFISDVQFIIDNCKEINDDAKYLIDKLNI